MGLGEGKGGSSQAIPMSIDTYTLVDQHSYKAHQVACSLVAYIRSEPGPSICIRSILETALKTDTEGYLGTTSKIGQGPTGLYYAYIYS